MVVDIGSYGRHSDSAIFENSAFFYQYIDGKTILPSKPLPGTDNPVQAIKSPENSGKCIWHTC